MVILYYDMGINTTGGGEVLMGMYAWQDDER